MGGGVGGGMGWDGMGWMHACENRRPRSLELKEGGGGGRFRLLYSQVRFSFFDFRPAPPPCLSLVPIPGLFLSPQGVAFYVPSPPFVLFFQHLLLL